MHSLALCFSLVQLKHRLFMLRIFLRSPTSTTFVHSIDPCRHHMVSQYTQWGCFMWSLVSLGLNFSLLSPGLRSTHCRKPLTSSIKVQIFLSFSVLIRSARFPADMLFKAIRTLPATCSNFPSDSNAWTCLKGCCKSYESWVWNSSNIWQWQYFLNMDVYYSTVVSV